MKKIIFISIIVTLVTWFSYPMTAKAEINTEKTEQKKTKDETNESKEEEIVYGLLNIAINMPTGVVGDVTLNLTNKTRKEDVTVYLKASQKNKYSFTTPLGTYTLKSSSVCSTDGYDLGYIVKMQDFTMDMSNPNGDWSWNVTGDVKAEVPVSNPTTEPLIQSDTNVNTDVISYGEEQKNTDIISFTIDSNNAYFPNMTIPQIQEWYSNEVSSFIETGKTDKIISDFQSAVTQWSDWVTRKKDAILDVNYDVNVNKFNNEDTKDFYQVQKKMYDFLKDYYQENGTSLNFGVWTYDNTEADEPTMLPVENDNNTVTLQSTIAPVENDDDTSQPTPTVTNERAEQSKEDEVETVSEPTPTPEQKNSNKFVQILKSAWFFIVVIILLIIGVIVWKIKYKKSDD